MSSSGGLTEPSSDAELVGRVLAGDREAFAQVYDRYGNKLFDFAYSMLRHREEAADAVADSFVLFAERLGQLREPDRLRPWLYAIVRSECLRRLKARKRVAYDGEEHLIAMADTSMTPDDAAEQAALRQLVWDAAEGLADRDRALLDLHLRQGLEGAELGEAMGVSASNAYVMLNRLRAQVERSLGALLIARMGRDECPALDELLADWDGTFSVLIRKRVARHVEKCEVCSERRKLIVSPWALLAGVPMFAAPLSLRDRVLTDTQLVAYSTPPSAGSGWSATTTKLTVAGVALLAIVAGVIGFLLWPSGADDAPAPEPTPTLAPTETPSPTPTEEPLAPADLQLSATVIDLGRNATQGSVTVTNAGELPLDLTAATSDGWLTVSPAAATLEGGESAPITVRADRGRLREGAATGSVVITWEGGTVPITVRLTHEIPPTVGAPNLGASTCSPEGRTHIVTASATDTSGLRSVVLSWSGPSSGSVSMSRSGNTWTAAMGPIPVGGSFTMKVTATDNRGNVATRSATAGIDPCPV